MYRVTLLLIDGGTCATTLIQPQRPEEEPAEATPSGLTAEAIVTRPAGHADTPKSSRYGGPTQGPSSGSADPDCSSPNCAPDPAGAKDAGRGISLPPPTPRPTTTLE